MPVKIDSLRQAKPHGGACCGYARTQVNRISGDGGAAARGAEVQWLALWPPNSPLRNEIFYRLTASSPRQ
jgi:hypothetical protein